jgi:6-phosphogluconolactonase/glucosamine-6-phosphate isomerase/deaminase
MSTNISPQFFESSEMAKQAATAAVEQALRAAANEDQPVLLLLSGGSNLQVAAKVDKKLFTDTVTVMVLDERFSAEDDLNNSLQVKAAGLPVVETVPLAGESLAEFAARFEKIITDWQTEFPDGVIVATLGMGGDGHIAGISPFPEDEDKFDSLFVDTNQLVVGYEGNLSPVERVTVTVNFLKLIDVAIGYVVGDSKKSVLAAALNSEQKYHHLPFTVVNEMKSVQVMTA